MSPLEEALRVLAHDGTVVYPTETVYGLGGDALSDEAILKVYEAKRRQLSNPVSVAVSGLEMMEGIAKLNEAAEILIERFLPGPVTIVLPAKRSVASILTGGTGMIGIRYPGHPMALELISGFDSPITATSANISGGKDPVLPDECSAPHDYLIDGGRLPGTPSTVVDMVSRKILRRGALADAVQDLLSDLETAS